MSYEMLKKLQAANRLAADTVQYGEGKGIWDFPEMTDATRKAAREHFANLMNENVEQLLSGNVGYRDREVFARLKKEQTGIPGRQARPHVGVRAVGSVSPDR